MPAVLAGDYNVVPTDFDIYIAKSFADNALVQPAPRAMHPDDPHFTFRSYLRNRQPRDAGLRLDHLLLSPAIAPCLKAAGVDRDIRGKPEASES